MEAFHARMNAAFIQLLFQIEMVFIVQEKHIPDIASELEFCNTQLKVKTAATQTE